jgi:tetratricopeptide (TPR) repeat protein
MNRCKIPFTPFLLVLLPSSLVYGQEPFSWVGQKVAIKYNYPVKVGDRVVDDGIFHIYTVSQVNGDWLWVTWQNIEGWVPVSRVVLFDQAIDFYTNEIRNNPSNFGAYGNRGIIWYEKNEYDIAIADLNDAIRLDPSYFGSYHWRGRAWGNKKEYDKAIADFNEAIRLNPQTVIGYCRRGNAWERKKEYKRAFDDYNQAIRLDPRFPLPFSYRAWLWATCTDPRFRDGKKAVESATTACKLSEWKQANPVNSLAAAYAESGDFVKAVEWQEKANRLCTDDESRRKGEERLKLYKEKKPYRDEG